MCSSYLNTVNINFAGQKVQSFGAKSGNSAADSHMEKLVKRVDEEKEKKHNRTAFAVGGSVVILSLLLTALNPRFSSKLVERLRALQQRAGQQIEKNKDNLIKTKFYKFLSECTDWFNRFLSYTNNINSVKDTYYKKLCTEEKTFLNIHNLERRKRFEKYDEVFRKIMQKPHELITKWGDNLAKMTVNKGYKTAGKRMDKLEELLKQYSDKLPVDKRKEYLEKLSRLCGERQYFSLENTGLRLTEQENLMRNLNEDIRNTWQDYKRGFTNKYVKNAEHFNQYLSFWAQDIMQPERARLEKAGLEKAGDLIKAYGEVVDTVSANLTDKERKTLERAYKKANKDLLRANKQECADYFDKKRDLILGSAPTDILSSVILLTTGGVALAATDDEDKKISKLLTGIIPTAAGLLTNIALTTMLFSGTKGMLYGFGLGGVLSLIGSKIDKMRLSLKNKLPEE